MSEERARILGMLAAGKITAEEAERLLDALQTPASSAGNSGTGTASAFGPLPPALVAALPRFLYVKVVSQDGDNVNVKIPLALVRSGLKLTSLIPPQAMEQINREMADKGVTIDFSALKPDDIEELIQALTEMEVNVDSKNGDNVRVFCG